jgi:hypothetical protein
MGKYLGRIPNKNIIKPKIEFYIEEEIIFGRVAKQKTKVELQSKRLEVIEFSKEKRSLIRGNLGYNFK